MLTSRLLYSATALSSWANAALVAAAGRSRTFAESSTDKFAQGAAAGGSTLNEDEGPVKTHQAQNELPDIGGYGDDPVAAGAKASDATEGAIDETRRASRGALEEASQAASGAVGAAAASASGAVSEAASAALGAMQGVAETAKPEQPPAADDAHNVAARGEAPDTSGHAMEGWPRWKKEADDAMQGGSPEPGIVLE